MRKSLFCLLLLAIACTIANAQSAPIVAQVTLTNQTAGIPPTVLVNPSVDGLYRVTFYFNALKGSPRGEDDWTLSIKWFDTSSERVKTFEITTIQGEMVPLWNSASIPVYVKAGTSLTYATSDLLPNRQSFYDLFITVEQLQ
jgi:hypothetical protein